MYLGVNSKYMYPVPPNSIATMRILPPAGETRPTNLVCDVGKFSLLFYFFEGDQISTIPCFSEFASYREEKSREFLRINTELCFI